MPNGEEILNNMKEENNQDYHDFFISCRDGKINNVTKYFKIEFINGIEINNKCYENPLFVSAIYKHKKVFDYLLTYKANINIYLNDARGYLMPLISKIIKYQFDIASSEYFQTDEGFEETDEDEIDKAINQLLFEELYYIESLIKHGANINASSEEEGNSVLDISYIYRNKHAYELLQRNGALHSKKFLETYHDKYPEWEKLLKKKHYIETDYIIEPYIPKIHQLLFKQIENQKKYNSIITLDFLKVILEQLNDPNEKDYMGRTALDYAIEIGHTLAVDYLNGVSLKSRTYLSY